MSENIPIEKSCGSPQLLPGSEPNNEWLPEQLGIYAQAQYQQIVDNETYLSLPYWRLGHALEIAKKSFGHGQWEQYLKSLGIDPTRASKARAIYRTFACENDVAHLTVEAAYARRRKRQSAAPPAHAPKRPIRRRARRPCGSRSARSPIAPALWSTTPPLRRQTRPSS